MREITILLNPRSNLISNQFFGFFLIASYSMKTNNDSSLYFLFPDESPSLYKSTHASSLSLSLSLSLSQFTKFPNILSFQFYNIIARTQLNRRPNRIEPPSCFKKNVQKIVECENRTRVHYDNRLSHNHRTKIIIS